MVLGQGGFVVEGDLRAGGLERVRQGGIAAEHQGVAILPVLIPVVPAECLPSAVQVVVVALVELHRVGHDGVGAEGHGPPVGGLVVGEDFAGLLFHGGAVEDVVVLAQPQEGEPWEQHHVVLRKVAFDPDEAEFENVAAEPPGLALLARQLDRHQLAEHRFERDARIVGQHLYSELEVARQALQRVEAVCHHRDIGAVVLREVQAHQLLVLAIHQGLKPLGAFDQIEGQGRVDGWTMACIRCLLGCFATRRK